MGCGGSTPMGEDPEEKKEDEAPEEEEAAGEEQQAVAECVEMKSGMRWTSAAAKRASV
ncbi:hypothetical protein FOA52_000612 [Chlamydomonas sp. UWO 241]|nr:hypothetical protein FOA52_000612 [Chlamydomonas sp. UWO 241]